MDNQRLAQKLCRWKPAGNRTVGRPKIGWEDDMVNDLKKI